MFIGSKYLLTEETTNESTQAPPEASVYYPPKGQAFNIRRKQTACMLAKRPRHLNLDFASEMCSNLYVVTYLSLSITLNNKHVFLCINTVRPEKLKNAKRDLCKVKELVSRVQNIFYFKS